MPLLLEPIPRPPVMSGGMRAAIRVVLVFIAALVFLGTLGGLGTLAYALGGSRIVNDTQALPDGMRSLAVDTGDVPVSVRLITDADATEPRIDLRMLTSTDTQLTVANDGPGSLVTLATAVRSFCGAWSAPQRSRSFSRQM